MDLNDLIALQRASESHDSICDNFTKAADTICNHRKSDRSFTDIITDTKSWNYNPNLIAKNALFEVLNEQKHELLRLTELRLQAKARDQKIKAAQKRDILAASILPTTED